MATLRDTIGLTCSCLPNGPHLLRLSYILYLTDWSSAVVQGRRVTTLKWLLSAHGPRAEAVDGFLANSREFKLMGAKGPSAIVLFEGLPPFPSLNKADSRIIQEIIRVTEDLNWSQMQRLIHQSDPVMFGRIDQDLDLEYFARTKRPLPAPRSVDSAGRARLAAPSRTG